MKIYKMNDFDWYAGENLEDCTAALLESHGGDYQADELIDNPREVTNEEMNRLIVTHETFEGKEINETFAAGLVRLIEDKQKFPRMFASTEY